MQKFASSLLALWKQLGLNQRVSLVLAALVVAGGMAALLMWARRPDYQLLYGKLSERDTAAVITHLQGANIPYRVNGSTVFVASDQVYKVRMDLAAKGLPSGDSVGYEIFDKGQFGLSDFVQRTNYFRAIQGELARTIMQVQGVQAARVMIVQPENRLLLTDQAAKSTASVFIDLGGGRLELDQVNAIRHLVANAVQGLQPDQVAVVDNHGRVLSEELKQDPTLGTATSQIRYRQQIEDYLGRKVETMLAQVLGPGQAVVRVSAEIDNETTTSTAEKFDPEGQVVRTQTITEDVSNSTETKSTGGATGVSANVPEKAQGTAPATRPTSSNEQNRKNRTTTYEINRTTTSTTRAPGAIKSLTAAVFVAERPAPAPAAGAPANTPAPAPAARTPQELEALRQIVINALGLHAGAGERPDTLVTLYEMPFTSATPPALSPETRSVQTQWRWQGWIEAASRWGAVLLAAAVFLFFWRQLSRQKIEPVPVEVLALSPEAANRALPQSNGLTPEALNELIRAKPAHVGVALREWVGSNKN
ncbi:MAG TPA: flagellar basal-body MS-ring/collar protein FliF [Opitutus sp.]|nr:flagellar basal-body MS-ring/collar protein FliF [Opitutus sp.]